MFNPPILWANQPLSLFHGTLLSHANSIVANGISVTHGRRKTDFGPGFYATVDLGQAQGWAWQLAQGRGGGVAAVVSAEIDRNALAALSSLSFVRGHPDAEDFWSFVAHCRSGAADHGRNTTAGAICDVVYGPVAAIWRQRRSLGDAEQISFHTPAAEAVLNQTRWRIL